jgi:bacterial/archaeal transporter family-2 protein
MDLFLIVLALAAGACAPIQAGVNSQLRLVTRDPVLASLISFTVGTLALLMYSLLARIPWPAAGSFLVLPWWMWTGGFLGAFLVLVSVILAPKLGAATMLGFMIAGQMITSVVLDHYGWIGYEHHPATVWRLLGAALLVAGVVIIKKF